MKKKILIFIMLLVILVVLLLFFGVGGKRTDVNFVKYEFSEDGTKLKFEVLISSSAGYIRTFQTKQVENKQYLTFYSTFGINNRWGAKKEFVLEIDPVCEEIYIDKGDEGYCLAFQKGAEGKWRKSN